MMWDDKEFQPCCDSWDASGGNVARNRERRRVLEIAACRWRVHVYAGEGKKKQGPIFDILPPTAS